MIINSLKQRKGITLVALVITIIVLLILAGVTLNIVLNSGIINKSQTAVSKYNEQSTKEKLSLALTEYKFKQLAGDNPVLKTIISNIGGKVTRENADEWTIKLEGYIFKVDKKSNEIKSIEPSNEEPLEYISTSTTGDGYIGCYADIDGDGSIDGIIYVDLLVAKPVSGNWNNDSDGAYTIPPENYGLTAQNVKEYVISNTPVVDPRFDETARYVITEGTNTENKKDRFYVMGLDNITDGTNSKLYWYKKAYGRMPTTASTLVTSTDFGAGKTNTETMINIYFERNGKTKYGEQNDRDMWKNIDTLVSEGWFVPSRGEWAAFAQALNVSNKSTDATYYRTFKLNDYYWSSSQYIYNDAWYISFTGMDMSNYVVDDSFYVRLSITF